MLFEFAIEPEALATWANFRYFVDRIGNGHGRLISKYPEAWPRLVWAACTETSTINRKKIEAGLNDLRNRLLKTRRRYDDGASWFQNALRADQLEPFHAIITTSTSESDRSIHADDLNDDSPLWRVERDGRIKRTATAMASLAEPLLMHSTEISFIDQHFSTSLKFIRPLNAFLEYARRGKKVSRVEYHLAESTNTSSETFRAGLERQKRHLNLADDESISFIRWKCKEEGENLHARYILSNRGGIQFDYGLDEGDGTTTWTRLSDELWIQCRQHYVPEANCFDLVDAWKVTCNDVVKIVRNSGRWVNFSSN